MSESTAPPATTKLSTSAFIERAQAMVTATGRTDLTALLTGTRRRWEEPTTRVMVIGEFKQGKSALVNSLLNAPLCKVGDDVTTAVPTIVSFAQVPSARVVDAPDADSITAEDLRSVSLPLDQLQAWDLNAHEGAGRRVQHLEVSLPRDLLHRGLVLVDTPGVGGLRTSQSAVTVAALPSADAVLFVSDATAEYSATELEFLAGVLKICPNVTCVTTKTDLQPEWRRIVELNRGHLDRAGITAPIVPVSSLVRDLALRLKDQSLDEESGFPALTRHLEEQILGQAKVLAHRSVCRDVLTACDHIQLMLTPELRGLEDPGKLPDMIDELERANAEADELRARSARWQTTLNDGVADLTSDLDHDLRDRVRALTRDAENSIDSGDPGAVWDEFSQWLEARCADVLQETFTWAEANTAWLCDRVAEHFTADAGRALPSFAVGETDGLLGLAPELGDIDRGRLHLGQKVFIGMRGSYGGVLMFGLLTSIAGLALVNPISIGAGLLLGAKAYSDEKGARLQRRQAEAKAMVRRYLDDIQFQVLKSLRDRLRQVQRGLRDYYSTRADELQKSLAESLLAARAAAAASKAERTARIALLRDTLTEAGRLGNGAAKALRIERTGPSS
ncbi:dynamin family protein [Granulicoccus sp. GXG6511]|uniref:dynamin family protein n=1 Tax=Granulicoccus sp. GXG6511 TaxID=3381351 RepID=UPI003D7DA04C